MAPIFFRKAAEIRDRFEGLIAFQPHCSPASDSVSCTSTSAKSTTTAGTIIDIAHWTSRAAFDVIGLTGFDYDFHALRDESEEVYRAYRDMFAIADKGPGVKGLLSLYFPIIEKLLVCDITK